jgi:hypothetical protein
MLYISLLELYDLKITLSVEQTFVKRLSIGTLALCAKIVYVRTLRLPAIEAENVEEI